MARLPCVFTLRNNLVFTLRNNLVLTRGNNPALTIGNNQTAGQFITYSVDALI
ncbi:MAG: hypothetical protein M3Z70_07060 [Bartonella sp.]|nr:hypothetical protein [Bartonella sp.]